METLPSGALWANEAAENAIRTRARVQLAFLLTLILILAGCESTNIPPTVRNVEPLSCEIFTLPRWNEFRFGVDSPTDVVAKAVNLWGIEQEQIRYASTWRSDLSVQWSSSISGRDVNYSAWFGEERQLLGIDVSWRKPFATLSQVIDCLGAPDLYSARYEFDHEPQLDLSLWYVERGFSFLHYSYPKTRPHPPIKPAQRIDRFSVAAPLPLSRAFPDLYMAGTDPVRPANALCLIKPWPGSIEAIEVTWFDNDSRCRLPPRMSW